jgi:GntR family transcriptional repressor for pyruvate dehydrogenase complex
MKFKRIKTTTVSESIVEQLEEMILNGELKAGDKLPPERELAQQLQVSRPTLREALVIMEAKGLLQVRRGGAHVCDVLAQTVTDPLVHLLKRRAESSFDVLELRLALEEVAAYYAALRATDADRQILQERWKALEASYENYELAGNADADVELHMAIADASHNVALALVMRGLFNLLRSTITSSLEKIYAEPGSIDLIRNHHRKMLDAVIAKKPDEAREAAHTHLAFVQETMRQAATDATPRKRSRRKVEKGVAP